MPGGILSVFNGAVRYGDFSIGCAEFPKFTPGEPAQIRPPAGCPSTKLCPVRDKVSARALSDRSKQPAQCLLELPCQFEERHGLSWECAPQEYRAPFIGEHDRFSDFGEATRVF